jgi:alanyl-tRNA synthetase
MTGGWGGGQGGGGRSRGFFEPSGGDALPGTYKVVMEYGGESSETSITVHADPRIKPSPTALEAKDNFLKKVEALSSEVSAATKKLDEAQKVIDKVNALIKDLKTEDAKALETAAKDIKKKLDATREAFTGPKVEGQGIVRNLFPTTMTHVFAPRSYANSSYAAPGATEERLLNQGKEAAAAAIEKAEAFIQGEWKAFEEKVKATPIDLFGNIKK